MNPARYSFTEKSSATRNRLVSPCAVYRVWAPDSDILIGMDIINRGDFAVSNKNGATTFSFRIPSVEDFDFVKGDEAYKH